MIKEGDTIKNLDTGQTYFVIKEHNLLKGIKLPPHKEHFVILYINGKPKHFSTSAYSYNPILIDALDYSRFRVVENPPKIPSFDNMSDLKNFFK